MTAKTDATSGTSATTATTATDGAGPPPRFPSPAPDGDVVLELRGVEKQYPGSPPVKAVAGVDLTVRRGELMALVGPSGSGKSTMLNLLGALERPSGGSVRIGGADTATLNDRALSGLRAHRIGFVFQGFHLVSGLSALDNVAMGLLYRGVPARARRTAARVALERVGLGDRAHHRPTQLSGGECQRVAIARAVVGEPDVVLADEPTGNLDSRSGDAVVGVLRRLWSEGTTVVVITHDLSLASDLPRGVRIRDGRIEADGPGRALVGAGR